MAREEQTSEVQKNEEQKDEMTGNADLKLQGSMGQAHGRATTQAQGRVRITLDVTQPMKEVIDRLADEAGTTQAEVLRRAIALFKVVKNAESTGEGEAALVKNGQVVAKLVGI